MNIVQLGGLESLDLPELTAFRDLTDVALRSRVEPSAGIYMAESTKVIRRAIDAGHEVVSVILEQKWFSQLEPYLSKFDDVTVFLGAPELLESLTGFHVHRGAIAAIRRPTLPPMEDLVANASRVVILEDIVDHTNVGAAFRAVAGLGADAVLVSQRCADPLYRRSVRVSMGTVLQVPWTRMPQWSVSKEVLHRSGFDIASFALDARAVSLDEFARNPPAKLAIVLGSEGHGLSREALNTSDHIVTIPMLHGVDSLNVASACAVALWALRPAVSTPTLSGTGPVQ